MWCNNSIWTYNACEHYNPAYAVIQQNMSPLNWLLRHSKILVEDGRDYDVGKEAILTDDRQT